MNNESKTANFERSIERYYDQFSVKRIALATLLVGLGSLLAAFLVLYFTGSALFAGLACLVTGFALTNVCFLTIVPPARSLDATKAMICAALRDPGRIVAYDRQKVQLRDEKGRTHTLKARDMAIWTDHVVPHLIASQAGGNVVSSEKAPRKLTASERRYIEERRKEVIEMEKGIAEERKRIESDRKELEARTADVDEAEEVVIARLKELEAAAEDIEERAMFVTESENSLIERLDALTHREATIEQNEIDSGHRKD